MPGRSRVNVKVEPRSTVTFTRERTQKLRDSGNPPSVSENYWMKRIPLVAVRLYWFGTWLSLNLFYFQ